MITRRHVAAALLPLVFLAACTTEETGTPTTAPATPSFGAPAVPHPLDIDAFAADPCSSLTPEQQDEFMVDSGNDRTVANGNKCDYGGGTFMSVLYSTEKSGLSYLYELNEHDIWSRWEPMEVDGYPAVLHVNRNKPEVCDVAVGLSDTAYVSVSVLVSFGDDACPPAEEGAERVMETIKAAQ